MFWQILLHRHQNLTQGQYGIVQVSCYNPLPFEVCQSGWKIVDILIPTKNIKSFLECKQKKWKSIMFHVKVHVDK